MTASASSKVRGIQARGVVTNEDGGVNWSVSATLPSVDVVSGDVFVCDTERLFVVTPTGGCTSRTGSVTWDDISLPVTTDSFVPSRAAIRPDDADVLFMSGIDDVSFRDDGAWIAAVHGVE